MKTMRDLELKAMRKGGMRATVTRNLRARSQRLARQTGSLDRAADKIDGGGFSGGTGKARALRKRGDRKHSAAGRYRRWAQALER
ncbi:MAG: hypothetical protein ACRDD1_21165 [Planctomycetia bacterium]